MNQKLKVYLTRELPSKTMEMLAEKFDLKYNTLPRALSNDELIRNAKGCAAIITLLTDKINKSTLEQLPDLKIISNYAVGYNNIDCAAASNKGVAVTNTPGVLTDTSADTAFALMLAVARRVSEADSFVRTGQWKGWYPTELLGKDVWGSSLGIIGFGRIGRAVAERASGFKMKVYYWNRTRLTEPEESELNLNYLPLEKVIETSDFISLHVAYTEDTHHLISKKMLELFKPTSFLINTSRGAVVDEVALVAALKNGKLAGAGLDVYEKEPEIHPELLELKNTVLLPHLGSASLATREAMGQIVYDNLLAFANGNELPNRVN